MSFLSMAIGEHEIIFLISTLKALIEKALKDTVNNDLPEKTRNNAMIFVRQAYSLNAKLAMFLRQAQNAKKEDEVGNPLWN